MLSVFGVFVLSTDKKKQVWNLWKNAGHVFFEIFNRDVFVWFGWKNNPFPASQVRFPHFLVIETFCVKGRNKRSIVGNSSNDIEFFIDRTLRASISPFSALRKMINASAFYPRNSGRGGLTSGLA